MFSIKAGKYICGNSASLTWECWDKTLYNNGWNSGTINLNYGDIVSVETYSPEIDYHQINIRVRSNMYDVNADSVTSYSFFTDPASDSFYEGNTVETYVRLPEITSADNGKILQVVDGRPQLVENNNSGNTTPTELIPIVDSTTNKTYNLYVSNGKLMLSEEE